jgi:predicted nucleotide-binding protein
MMKGVERLRARIADLEAFDPYRVPDPDAPQVAALRIAIDDTLVSVFGKDTLDYERYSRACLLNPGTGWEHFFSKSHTYFLKRSRNESIAIIREAIRGLEEKLAQRVQDELSGPVHASSTKSERKVFVVHGHDEGAREAIARFLERIGLEAIILHEQANRGRTVIEKVESHGDVRFAIVLLTPDDEGCAKGGSQQPRARQNVILELGYFIGRLGRNSVCALKRGELEIPSDFGGVVYDTFDATGGWKQAIGRELMAAGFEIDWNLVMRS